MTAEIIASEKVVEQEVKQTSNTLRFIRVFLARKTVVASLAIILTMIICAIFAPLIAPFDPYKQDYTQILADPSLAHPLGTDLVGRDVLSRIIYGSQAALLVGIVSVAIASVIGIILGLFSGYVGGLIDAIIMRAMDALMAIPPIILAVVFVAAFGGGLTNVIITLGLSLVPTYARLMRGQVLAIRDSDFIVAQELMGSTNLRNMIKHVLPNCISPLIVLITLNFGVAILAEAGLSFLGLGIVPPKAAWGSMINDGYKYLLSNPILSFAPGMAVVLVVVAFNIVGDALRDALDPRLKGTL
jgi:peptide/nickel transport system permease protein